MPTYEVAVYNAAVREAVADEKRHPRYADEWADLHFIEVEAVDADAARAKINRKYPQSDGFVADDITEI